MGLLYSWYPKPASKLLPIGVNGNDNHILVNDRVRTETHPEKIDFSPH